MLTWSNEAHHLGGDDKNRHAHAVISPDIRIALGQIWKRLTS